MVRTRRIPRGGIGRGIPFRSLIINWRQDSGEAFKVWSSRFLACSFLSKDYCFRTLKEYEDKLLIHPAHVSDGIPRYL